MSDRFGSSTVVPNNVAKGYRKVLHRRGYKKNHHIWEPLAGLNEIEFGLCVYGTTDVLRSHKGRLVDVHFTYTNEPIPIRYGLNDNGRKKLVELRRKRGHNERISIKDKKAVHRTS